MSEPTTITPQVLNGSDLLLFVGDKAIGHSASCTININAELRDLVYKPVATAPAAKSKFKKKDVTGLSCNITFDGLVFLGETESSVAELGGAIMEGEEVVIKVLVRGQSGAGSANTSNSFLTGSFIISSLTITGPAEDSATYNGQLDNSGEFKFEPTKFTGA